MGLVDQVVIIEKTAALIFIGVTPDHLDRDSHKRRRPVAADDAVATLDELGDAVLFGAEQFGEFRIVIGKRVGNHVFSRLALTGQKEAEIMAGPPLPPPPPTSPP